MRRTETFIFVLNRQEKAALNLLAASDGASKATTLRRLLLNEARQRGLLGPADSRAPVQAGQSATAQAGQPAGD